MSIEYNCIKKGDFIHFIIKSLSGKNLTWYLTSCKCVKLYIYLFIYIYIYKEMKIYYY